MVDVQGLVTLDGAPFGVSDASGHFTLRSQTDLPGAAPGKYRITVIKVEAVHGGAKATSDGLLGFVPPGMQEKWHTPARYADFRQSGLNAEVQPRMPAVELKLTKKA